MLLGSFKFFSTSGRPCYYTWMWRINCDYSPWSGSQHQYTIVSCVCPRFVAMNPPARANQRTGKGGSVDVGSFLNMTTFQWPIGGKFLLHSLFYTNNIQKNTIWFLVCIGDDGNTMCVIVSFADFNVVSCSTAATIFSETTASDPHPLGVWLCWGYVGR